MVENDFLVKLSVVMPKGKKMIYSTNVIIYVKNSP